MNNHRQNEAWSRVKSLDEGTVMAVTDLHGDWDAYCLYRDRFLADHQAGHTQYLALLGDFIHRDSAPEEDKSLAIVLDLIELQQTYPQAVIVVCGNHELAHIYNQTLARGNFLYTARFEAQMGPHRARIIAFFRSLPFYVRTAAGICLTHAGAADMFAGAFQPERLLDWRHQTVFERVDRALAGKNMDRLRDQLASQAGTPYAQQAQYLLAVNGADDPRFDDLLRGRVVAEDYDFQLVKQALSTRCEIEYGARAYKRYLGHMLKALSVDYATQRFCIAGHIDVTKGVKAIGPHVRIASGKHALEPDSACYLQFDAAATVRWRRSLMARIQPAAR